jgi:hypothetical protein
LVKCRKVEDLEVLKNGICGNVKSEVSMTELSQVVGKEGERAKRRVKNVTGYNLGRQGLGIIT